MTKPYLKTTLCSLLGAASLLTNGEDQLIPTPKEAPVVQSKYLPEFEGSGVQRVVKATRLFGMESQIYTLDSSSNRLAFVAAGPNPLINEGSQIYTLAFTNGTPDRSSLQQLTSGKSLRLKPFVSGNTVAWLELTDKENTDPANTLPNTLRWAPEAKLQKWSPEGGVKTIASRVSTPHMFMAGNTFLATQQDTPLQNGASQDGYSHVLLREKEGNVDSFVLPVLDKYSEAKGLNDTYAFIRADVPLAYPFQNNLISVLLQYDLSDMRTPTIALFQGKDEYIVDFATKGDVAALLMAQVSSIPESRYAVSIANKSGFETEYVGTGYPNNLTVGTIGGRIAAVWTKTDYTGTGHQNALMLNNTSLKGTSVLSTYTPDATTIVHGKLYTASFSGNHSSLTELVIGEDESTPVPLSIEGRTETWMINGGPEFDMSSVRIEILKPQPGKLYTIMGRDTLTGPATHQIGSMHLDLRYPGRENSLSIKDYSRTVDESSNLPTVARPQRYYHAVISK